MSEKPTETKVHYCNLCGRKDEKAYKVCPPTMKDKCKGTRK